MSLADYLARRLGPTVDLHVSLDGFRFQCGTGEQTLAPLARVDEEGKFSALGDEVRTTTDGRLVAFFADRHRRGQPWPHENVLAMFCRYAMALVRLNGGVSSGFRSNVRVTGSRSLRDVLDHEERIILARALRAAGAASVSFPDLPE